MKTSIKNLKKIGEDFLKEEIGEGEAKRSSELLLTELLNLNSPLELFHHQNKSLHRPLRNSFFENLKRRKNREPLQYILKDVSFMDITLRVNQHCLIPRPEMEMLVEKIIETANPGIDILDIGTGSGNIAISLAFYLKSARITAVDFSKEALKLAEENADRNQVAERITFKESDLFSALEPTYQFDIIAANLPYLSEEEFLEVEEELLFEPKTALVAEENGLKLIEKTIQTAPQFLKPEGKLFLEIGSTQGNAVKDLLEENNFKNIEIIKDYAGHDRVAKATVKSISEPKHNSLHITLHSSLIKNTRSTVTNG